MLWKGLHPEEFRYERKFFISEASAQEVEHVIRMHPACFSEIFHERFVNNIYLDSPELHAFNDNLGGANKRVKVRIRWYGDLLKRIENPMLELKIKENALGTKRTFKLPSFNLKEGTKGNAIHDILRKAQLPKWLGYEILTMEPSLINRYSRKYFQSFDKAFRVTIDRNLSYFRVKRGPNSFLESIGDDEGVILELKYDKPHDSSAADITKLFPFRMTRSSKYVMGVQQLLE